MLPLPAIVGGPKSWVLPMADRSAGSLAELLLAQRPSDMVPALADVLDRDPPLSLWVFYWAVRRGRLEPRSVRELAEWLAEHALDLLQWPDGSRPLTSTAGSQIEAFARCAGESLAVAELAARLAAREGAADTSAAYLGGQLHNAAEWFALAASDRSPGMPEPVSGPVSGPLALRPDGDGRWVAQAIEILNGRHDPAEWQSDVALCRQRAADGCRAWGASLGGIGLHLPALAARLARLEQLENRFHQTLEHEKLEAMAELAAGAGHEINNPLAIIAGRAQLFLKDESDPERRRELAMINAQVMRAHEMIADLRLFARPPRPEFQPLDLVALLDQVLGELGPQASERATSLTRAECPQPFVLDGDPIQLSVAFRALVTNALEAIGHGGHVAVTVEGSEEAVAIQVSDDGPGITPGERRHVFDPFFSARQAGRGLGMGLPKCWRIVTNHGGRIDVESEPGKRTAFTIALPRRQAHGKDACPDPSATHGTADCRLKNEE